MFKHFKVISVIIMIWHGSGKKSILIHQEKRLLNFLRKYKPFSKHLYPKSFIDVDKAIKINLLKKILIKIRCEIK
jgi:hypothetical protein